MRRIVFGLILLGSTLFAQAPALHNELISARRLPDGSIVQGNGDSTNPSISADGRYVAFESRASNLVDNDTNGVRDIFVYGFQANQIEFQTNRIKRVSVSSSGEQAISSNDAGSQYPRISSDGRFIAFQSKANNLVSGDTSDSSDVFVHDRQTGQTFDVSPDRESGPPIISGNNRYVVYGGELIGSWQGVFVFDIQTRVTARVDVNSDGTLIPRRFWRIASINDNGRYVAFLSLGERFVEPSIFIHDRDANENGIFDETIAGGRATFSFPVLDGTRSLKMTADGQYVFYNDKRRGTGQPIVSMYDLQTRSSSEVFFLGITSRAGGGGLILESSGTGWDAHLQDVSSDGRYIAVSLSEPLLTEDTNSQNDLYVFDRQTSQLRRVSLSFNGTELTWPVYTSSLNSTYSTLTNDGSLIAFASSDSMVVENDTNNMVDIFVTNNPLYADTTPPTAPTNLTATPLDSVSVRLTWAAATDNVGVTGYKIYRNAVAVTTLGNVTSHTDGGLTPLQTYTYQVSAVDAAGNESPQSIPPVSVTTPGSTAPPPSVTPTNLIPNPGFEKGTTDWSFPSIASVDFKYFHSGTASAKMYAASSTSNVISSSGFISVTAGKSYSFSAWIKRSSIVMSMLGGGVNFQVGWFNSSGSSVGMSAIVTSLTGTADWTQHSKAVTAPTGAATARIFLQFQNASGTAWFDDISMTAQ